MVYKIYVMSIVTAVILILSLTVALIDFGKDVLEEIKSAKPSKRENMIDSGVISFTGIMLIGLWLAEIVKRLLFKYATIGTICNVTFYGLCLIACMGLIVMVTSVKNIRQKGRKKHGKTRRYRTKKNSENRWAS